MDRLRQTPPPNRFGKVRGTLWGHTNYWSKSAKADSAWSSWPSNSSRCAAEWPSRSSNRAWTAARWSPALRPNGRPGSHGPPEHRPSAGRRRNSPGRPTSSWSCAAECPSPTIATRSRLTPRQRLALFVSVCQAVQHAHQGHHPPRPQAVERAGDAARRRPVVKVIDFGIAKALGQPADGQDVVHRLRATVGYSPVHEPRTSPTERPGHRHAQRHLFPGSVAVRTVNGDDAG